MEMAQHNLLDLFAQLGLPNEQAQVDTFIAAHRPLPDAMCLADAPFWTEAQARFLRDEVVEDADWASVVDELNVMLHR